MTMTKSAPFDIPTTRREWYRLLLVGWVLAFLLMGSITRFTDAYFIATISVAEAVGLAFATVWMFGLIGPLSPFRLKTQIGGKDE